MRATVTQTGDLPLITPFDRQDSALLSILSNANALLVRPVADGPRLAGDLVSYLPI
jgi:molybdopterin molybdotransferase